MTIKAPEPPGRGRAVVEAATRSVLGAVPWAGGAAVELFQAAVTRGRQRRFDAWVAEMTDAMNSAILEPRALTFESLAEDDAFLDAIGAATQAAVETSDQIKIQALRNAVLNSALAPDAEADRRAILMDVLVALTPSHIKLLLLFDDPKGWLEREGRPVRDNILMGGASTVVKDAYPELASDKTLLDRVVKDLSDKSLSAIPLNVGMTGEGIYARRTAPLGAELLDFIAEPKTSR